MYSVVCIHRVIISHIVYAFVFTIELDNGLNNSQDPIRYNLLHKRDNIRQQVSSLSMLDCFQKKVLHFTVSSCCLLYRAIFKSLETFSAHSFPAIFLTALVPLLLMILFFIFKEKNKYY